MHVPFQAELNDVFAKDRSIWLKIGGGAIVGALLSLRMITREPAKGMTDSVAVIVVGVTALIGACVGLALSIKDVVQSRRAAGKSVHPVLRLFFGLGILSLLIWIVFVIGLVIGLARLESMPAKKKRRGASVGSGAAVAANEQLRPVNRLDETAP
jgi:hypothetical protein